MKRKIIWILLLFLSFNCITIHATDNDEQLYKSLEIFSEVLRYIEKNYVTPQDPHKLIQNAIKGMVKELDPHSSYLTKEEHEELLIETKGSFTGIGIEITIRDNVLTVVSPIEGTPAYKAGLKAGDRIIKIDGVSTHDMTLMDAVKRIRGPKGTKVRLTIIRKDEEKPLEFEIKRDVIPLKSVWAHPITKEIGYIRISSFQGSTYKDLKRELAKLKQNGDLKGLILDLRNNPGGLLSQAVKVADMFLSSGTIVLTKGRKDSDKMEFKAHSEKDDISQHLIILVNEGSASASEIVAGALKDNHRAIILGTKTFGKGTVQTILPLSDGSGLRLTTAMYYTPSGRSIQLTGIEPDITVELINPAKKEGKSKKRFREKDLQEHFIKDKRSKDISKKSQYYDKKAEDMIKRDNQIRYAFELLRSWDLFQR